MCIRDRLTWNPNYKGFDDWQLALREKEQREKAVSYTHLDVYKRQGSALEPQLWRPLSEVKKG